MMRSLRVHLVRTTALLIASALCLFSCRRPAPNVNDYLAQGIQHARDGKYRAALVKFSTALQIDPSCDLAYLYMASLFEDYLNDRSNALATLHAYRNAAASEFSLRIASRLLYAAELEHLDQERQRVQQLLGTQRPSAASADNSDLRDAQLQLMLANERIAMLEQRLASSLLVTSSLPSVISSTTALSTLAVTVEVVRAATDDDLALALQRVHKTEDLLRRQTALVLMLEQRYQELQQRLSHEMELRTQLERAMQQLAGTSAAPRVAFDAPLTPLAPGDITHIVQPGDTLSSLAQRYYGDRELWMRIYIRNRSTMTSPDTLRQGQVIIIPR